MNMVPTTEKKIVKDSILYSFHCSKNIGIGDSSVYINMKGKMSSQNWLERAMVIKCEKIINLWDLHFNKNYA